MKTIRESLKEKFDNWLDERCDKGLNTYGHELDDCPDEKFDWRNMLIEELLDGLQYQEKEIRRLEKENRELEKRLEDTAKISKVFAKHGITPKEQSTDNPFFKGYKPSNLFFNVDKDK